MQFGIALKLDPIVDGAGIVLIRKPATAGMDNRKGVILQAHMDMVAKTAPGTVHDFDNEAIVAPWRMTG